ncbi:MAG: glycosyl hydrolase family 2 [Bacteroides sp.]|nr:hypothetical protein [Roseburia sp.]MCM1347322.1 glycosyl hydrolase family 2 [Bacteroides sp.]MCM1421825.1 glycosyl hydrolase family 2 [Bacteroides sp.]
MKNAKKLFVAWLVTAGILPVSGQQWITVEPEARPYTRWWWLGSAVDEQNLTYNLTEYAKAGIGGVEITPIYGVQENDKNDIPYLSPKWMRMLQHVETVGGEVGIETNMATGTGWPFGGPLVPVDEGAAKAIFKDYEVKGGTNELLDISVFEPKQKDVARLSCVMAYDLKETGEGDYLYKRILDLTSLVVSTPAASGVKNEINLKQLPKGDWRIVALYCGRTRQQVKRAAPGGEGLVIDHFDRKSVEHYLQRFDTAFVNQGVKPPHTFFNDSYEVYGADWTPLLLEEFEKRRGYKLQDFFPDFMRVEAQQTDVSRRIVSDYRQTMGELLYENFTTQWTDWAHKHGSVTRNQAHGSPANLIDIYAEVDIPECEGFGLSDFGIKGLRSDTAYTRKNFSDISMLKYASSGAHISGKKYTSSETFTWLTEHFRTSLSQCKPDIDLMFLSGINHVFFHGSCYSPREAEWPGWRFYASVDMTPNNSIWRDLPAFTKYIERCQSFLQWGEPDNDFLVYLPYYDMIYEQPDRIVLFDIHSMEKRAPKFIKTIQHIVASGYDVDYISDKYIEKTRVSDGHLTTTGKNAYSAIVIPDVQFMPVETLRRVLALAYEGAKVIFVASCPQGVPGYGLLKERQAEFDAVMKELSATVKIDFSEGCVSPYGKGTVICSPNYTDGLSYAAKKEIMREQGLSCIRRSNSDGYHYFISNLQDRDFDGYVTLSIGAKDAALYNPMTGEIGRAGIQLDGDNAKVRLQLASGESVILRTFNDASADKIMQECGENGMLPEHVYYTADEKNAVVLTGWTLSFVESAPKVEAGQFVMEHPKSWTELGDSVCDVTMGTGVYTTTFSLKDISSGYILDLGDVRESARVRINGQDCGVLFAVPFRMDVSRFLKRGENTLEVEVTNLPANRIAKLDRDGVQWRKFKEINVVDLNYKKNNYAGWAPVPSGLNSDVRLMPRKSL